MTGHAVCDGGLMIDLSPMREAHVDPRGRRVVGPGATWKDVDSASLRHGLATTGGIVSSTGVAGLTLGGGHGWLMRKHGLACDNLARWSWSPPTGRSAAPVPTRIRISSGASAEAAETFGIVTSFEFHLHPLDTVLAGLILHPLRRGRDVLERYRDVTMTAPDELVVGALVTTWFDGTPVIALAVCYSGRTEIGERIVEPLRRLGRPLLDTLRPIPYAELQTAFDATNPPGAWYYRTGYLDGAQFGGALFVETFQTIAISRRRRRSRGYTSSIWVAPWAAFPLTRRRSFIARPPSTSS